MRPQSENLTRLYHLRFSQMKNYRNQVWQILCSGFFQKLIPANSILLELGAGYGEFINNITCASKIAMDLNPITKDCLSQDIKYIQQDCSEQWDITSDYLDVIFTSNLLEHLQDKASIERTISESYRCLRKGGLLVCIGPNIKYVQGAYWDFWDHHVPLTELCLAELLSMHDFEIERCLPRFLPYSMSTGITPHLFLLKLYLRLPKLWPLFGKQFFIIARKRPKMEESTEK